MLDTSLKDQLKNIFAVLEARYTLDIAVAPQHESWQELTEMLADVAECSDKISCQIKEGKELEFSLLKNGEPTGIKFRGVPNGHEFTSLLLAIMNADGKGKNFPDKTICNRVKALKDNLRIFNLYQLSGCRTSAECNGYFKPANPSRNGRRGNLPR